jgi:hypothetical protein
MCSITEPRRVTVSCKHLFTSSINDRSTTTSSSFRRNNTNSKRNNFLPRSNKQQQQRLNEHFSNTKVFHTEKTFLSNNDKTRRTSLNPLSPVFYSIYHTKLTSQQKQEIIPR